MRTTCGELLPPADDTRAYYSPYQKPRCPTLGPTQCLQRNLQMQKWKWCFISDLSAPEEHSVDQWWDPLPPVIHFSRSHCQYGPLTRQGFTPDKGKCQRSLLQRTGSPCGPLTAGYEMGRDTLSQQSPIIWPTLCSCPFHSTCQQRVQDTHITPYSTSCVSPLVFSQTLNNTGNISCIIRKPKWSSKWLQHVTLIEWLLKQCVKWTVATSPMATENYPLATYVHVLHASWHHSWWSTAIASRLGWVVHTHRLQHMWLTQQNVTQLFCCVVLCRHFIDEHDSLNSECATMPRHRSWRMVWRKH